MGVGEAAAAEVGHGVGLAPDDVVQDPEAEILQDASDAEDVVIGADDPDGAVLLQQAAALAEPGAGEAVVFGEVGEAVPVVVDAVHQAVVGAAEFALELEVVGGVREDAVDGRRWQHLHDGDAVAQQYLVERQFQNGVHTWLLGPGDPTGWDGSRVNGGGWGASVGGLGEHQADGAERRPMMPCRAVPQQGGCDAPRCHTPHSRASHNGGDAGTWSRAMARSRTTLATMLAAAMLSDFRHRPRCSIARGARQVRRAVAVDQRQVRRHGAGAARPGASRAWRRAGC